MKDQDLPETPEELFVAPSSFAQERFWLLDRMDPGSAAYNVPLALRIAGDLDVERLRAALGELAERHESLRTALGPGEEGEPVQLIAPQITVELPVLDHSDSIVEEARRPFNLETIPLWRTVLYRLGEWEHLLLVTFHHSIVDAASLGILARELFAFYEGRGGELPELAIQYADFAEWQRQWLQGETLERKLYPWRQKLAGAPTSLALPFDRPAGRAGAARGGIVPFELPRDLGAALRAFARDSGVTLFTVVLAAFDALLFRHTGQEDLVVGTPFANRDRQETEGVVGLFLNTLALRVEMGDEPSFRDLVSRVREGVGQALAHADVPFEKLVAELRPERRTDQTPLFQALLAFAQPPVPSFETGGLSVEAVEIYTGTTQFDLTLHVFDGEAIGGRWEYPADRFDRTTIARLALHFERLLGEAVVHPGKQVSEMDLLSETERHQVRVEWSGDLPPAAEAGLLVHELFLRQAERTPDELAVIAGPDGEETLTYRELGRRARWLAGRLRRLGVGPDVRVGIAAGRTPDLAVGVLGILMAGGAYVPLDPEYPRHRLELMLEDADIAALVAHPALLDRLPDIRVPVLLAGEEGGEREEEIASGAGPDNLVYVLYTSGSTGRPKGVAMTHRALANIISWQLGAPGGRGLPAGTATLQLAPLTFDASFQELFATWAAGGTLVLIPEEMRREPEELLSRMDRFRVARIFLPSVALQQLAQAAERSAPPRGLREVREVVAAGEQLQVTPPVRSLFQRLPGATLHNQYGPTEAHVVTALSLLQGPPGPGEWPALPAIGRPIAGARTFLLDRRLAPVPAGVVGRLYLGGVCLARGYQGRPDWTAERFLPSPFSGLPGERLYDTGDLARFRADGVLEFLGRADQQVKVRGFRVEPGEVEAVLAEHPRVTASAVAARPGPGGDLRLVAWVVPGRPAPTLRELRDFLAARLPAPLVPAAWVEIAALPRTPSGKVDRAALPDPPPEAAPPAASGPRTPVEEVLAGIWAGILRLPAVGPDDNFFDLGGHSLTATTVTSQARQVFQVELPTRSLFESPTLRELAARIEQLLHAEEGLELPPILPAPRSPGMPLSFAQQRLWFLDELSGGETPFYNIAAALPLDGPLAPRAIGAMARAVAGIVARHEALRTTFAAGPEGRPVQVIHPPFAIPLPVTDLRGLPRRAARAADAEALRLARQEAGRPFSLSQGPLLRVGLLRLADTRQVLTVTFHHIVSDGWSLEVFVRELGILYGAALAGLPGELPLLPVQYADFALWQQRWLAGPALDAQLGYWRGDLAGAPFVLDLPTDRPRPALQTYRGRSLRLHLAAGPAALTAELWAVAREHRATLFMALLAPFAALLSRASGQTDILVGSPIANRNRAEAFGLIGCFVNMLVLRADLSRRPTWIQLLARVRETALSAYTHQDFPFERLVEELQPARDLSRNPLFQASFAMASTPWHELDLPGLSLGTLPGIDEGGFDTELFDLTLQIFETPQGLDARLSWNADLFDETTLRRLGGHLEALLADLAHRSERPVADVPLLGPGERHQLLVEWAGEPFAATPDSLLPLFAERVRQTPAAPALLWEEGELAYEELDRRANRLARRLAALGVGPESIVGLRLSGAADFVTAALAVWKAGGAYLPVDPQLPPERQALLLGDSGARALVTRASLAGPLPDLPTVRLDADRAALAALPAEAPEPLPDLPLAPLADTAAYVLYTSGSTGRPKGVVVPHGALAGHALEFLRRVGLSPDDRVLQLTSFSFDVSVDEIFPTLLAGAALVPWRPEVADPRGLASALREGEITVVNLTTALWHQAARAWADEGAPPLPRLRAVLVGGEAIPPGALRLWRRTPNAAVPLLHGYGLTETVVTSTLHHRGGGEGGRDLDTLAVGRPLAGRSLYLMDPEMNSVLLGAVGEVHLGGPALARGYLGRPDATAAAFVPDPWGPPGSRLYRTGDLARYRADGALEVLGRRDGQVKVRGFRIELGEVEAALLAHPGVREAAVLRRAGGGAEGEEGPEYGSLVAYVVGAAGPPPPAADLRAFLSGRLPGYMLPGSFVELPALPLTAGGKVDRRALGVLPGRRVPGSAGVPPAGSAPALTPDPLAARLAALWREILEVDEVRPDDNFFALGGHSMLLTLLRARLRQEWDVDLSVIEMFEHPTVASLARRLRQEEGLVQPSPAPAPAARPASGAIGAIGAIATGIAIVGMGGRFPGAPDLDRFWENLKNGVESISFFLPGGEAAWTPPARSFFHVPAGGVLAGADLWDAAFFGVPDREADLMDPQHRLFLEGAWEVLESAGYDTRRHPGRVGVFGGASKHDYLALLAAHGLLDDPETSLLASRGNEEDFLTTRVATQLDLAGPCLSIQAACSTSLAAVHLACQSLLAGECDLALAGGVSIGAPLAAGYYYQEGGLYSPDGHCRSYAAGANGSVNSDGVALVVLKRLADARADGDSIRAVILGTGLATDGAAPQASHRAEMIRRTFEKAAVSPDTITCVEGHGNATPLSDAMEVAALSAAFRSALGGTDRRGFCALGSVKSNLGHLHGACGLAGLVKTVLALEHRQIPPTLHCERPNPEIDFAASPFYLNTRLRDWESPGGPRRASVLSFGAGGIHAQVLLEEAPPAPATPGPRAWQLLVLSAKTASALEAATARLADHLAAHPDLSLPDIAWTLQTGRRAFEHRRAVLCRDLEDAVAALRGAGAEGGEGGEGDGEAAALRELGRLWTQGGEVDWPALHRGESRRRVPLPTYPFERRRHGFAAAPTAP